jgi:nucleoside-diphosphate-sugar epimerase
VRYVVTGAAGFIGSQLAEQLLARGDEVVGLDCFTDYYDPALKEENARGIEVRRVDLAEDDLDFAGFDGVFHLAGQPGTRSFGAVFPRYLRRNVLATQRVLEAAVAAGTKVVWASSSSVYGDAERYPTPEDVEPRPNNPYGITKLACEHLAATYARLFGLDAVALRYFTVYGPRQRPDMAFARIVDALARGESFEVYGDGTQSRSFTFVGDVVEATIRALDAPAGVYNVGGGEEATVREAIALLEGVSGRRLDVTYGPPATGDMRRTKADTTSFERVTGWRATTPLRSGLEAHWSWAAGRVAAR